MNPPSKKIEAQNTWHFCFKSYLKIWLFNQWVQLYSHCIDYPGDAAQSDRCLSQKSPTVTQEKEGERVRWEVWASREWLIRGGRPIWEQKRTRKPKQVITVPENGNQGMGVLQLLSHHFGRIQRRKAVSGWNGKSVIWRDEAAVCLSVCIVACGSCKAIAALRWFRVLIESLSHC